MRGTKVHLERTLWATDKSVWEREAPGVWAELERAYKGEGEDLLVHTSPKEGAKYGEVHVEKGLGTVYFRLGRQDEHYEQRLPAVEGTVDTSRGFTAFMEDVSRLEMALDRQKGKVDKGLSVD